MCNHSIKKPLGSAKIAIDLFLSSQLGIPLGERRSKRGQGSVTQDKLADLLYFDQKNTVR